MGAKSQEGLGSQGREVALLTRVLAHVVGNWGSSQGYL